ncbi:MAG: DUF2071 domain-containing protein [Spirosomataceae bacterium]
MLASFLTAEWRKLAMANYVVPADLLQPYLPKHTELDFFNGNCYVSLVGFLFDKVRLKGIPVPFHTSFEEVNLRFYVRYCDEHGQWKRGTTFIKEIVPKYAVSWTANLLYHEPYVTMPMRYHWRNTNDELTVGYKWKHKGWNRFEVVAHNQAIGMPVGSKEEFITEHYWGYTAYSPSITSEYGVEHPRWQVYPVKSYEIDVDFNAIYGTDFGFLTSQKPDSVLLAEGSAIQVRTARKLPNL